MSVTTQRAALRNVVAAAGTARASGRPVPTSTMIEGHLGSDTVEPVVHSWGEQLDYCRLMAGISASGRDELAGVLGRGARLVTVDDVSSVLDVSRADAARRLARWASLGWLRRIRRGLYIPVPVEAENPDEWSEDAFYLADAVWQPCYFTGWTTANH